MEGFEAIGGGGNFDLAGLEELLKAAVDELSDFAVDHRAGAHSHAEASGIVGLCEDDGGAVFRNALLICVPADGLNIELKAAEFAENSIPRALARLFEHECGFHEEWASRYTETRQRTVVSGSHTGATAAIVRKFSRGSRLTMATLAATRTDQPGSTLLDRIGNTPLVRLERIAAELPGVQILGKAEWTNPGGSVKDRAAASIVLEAMRQEKLCPGTRLLDATSGNTGIAYAMLGAAMAFPVTLCMPSNVSPERKRILKAYGAEVVWTDPAESSDGAIRKARELAKDPQYYYADQYSNDANWQAHYRTTANEILRQTDGRITHFVAGLGTSGTFMGVTRRLKEVNPEIECISMQPDSPFHGLEGLKHMATAIVPKIYDPMLADRNVEVETEAAYAMAKRLARTEGVLVGISAAAAVAAALRIGEEQAAQGKEAVIVTILPDAADKYLSERFWEE